MNLPQEEVRGKIVGLMTRLKTEVFPILRANKGEFVLNMHCTSAGITHLNLNFLDDQTHTGDVFDVPTILGGFNSPLIGASQAFDMNANELKCLIGALTDKDSDKPCLGEYDNKRLTRSLNAYDSTIPSSDPFGIPSTLNNISQQPGPVGTSRWGI